MDTPDNPAPPDDFTLKGELVDADKRAPGIYTAEAEPDGVGGQDPGFDGATPDDGEIDDVAAPAVDDDI